MRYRFDLPSVANYSVKRNTQRIPSTSYRDCLDRLDFCSFLFIVERYTLSSLTDAPFTPRDGNSIDAVVGDPIGASERGSSSRVSKTPLDAARNSGIRERSNSIAKTLTLCVFFYSTFFINLLTGISPHGFLRLSARLKYASTQKMNIIKNIMKATEM